MNTAGGPQPILDELQGMGFFRERVNTLTTLGRLAEETQRVIVTLTSLDDDVLKEAEKKIRRLLKREREATHGPHLREIRTANESTRILAFTGTERQRIIERYRVRPIVLKRLWQPRPLLRRVDYQRLASTYILQQRLYTAFAEDSSRVRVAAPGRSLTWFLEPDYACFGAVTLDELLDRFHGYEAQRGQEPRGGSWSRIATNLLAVRAEECEALLEAMHLQGLEPRAPSEAELHSFQAKLAESLSAATTALPSILKISRSLEQHIIRLLSGPPWEPYRDPSGTNTLYLPVVQDVAAAEADFRTVYELLADPRPDAEALAQFRQRLVETDFERSHLFVPRAVHHLHYSSSPKSGVGFAALLGHHLRRDPALLEQEVAAAAAYRGLREASHVLTGRLDDCGGPMSALLYNLSLATDSAAFLLGEGSVRAMRAEMGSLTLARS